MSKLGITVRQAAVLESGFELFDGAAMKIISAEGSVSRARVKDWQDEKAEMRTKPGRAPGREQTGEPSPAAVRAVL
jgi:hypothetical protein